MEFPCLVYLLLYPTVLLAVTSKSTCVGFVLDLNNRSISIILCSFTVHLGWGGGRPPVGFCTQLTQVPAFRNTPDLILMSSLELSNNTATDAE